MCWGAALTYRGDRGVSDSKPSEAGASPFYDLIVCLHRAIPVTVIMLTSTSVTPSERTLVCSGLTYLALCT